MLLHPSSGTKALQQTPGLCIRSLIGLAPQGLLCTLLLPHPYNSISCLPSLPRFGSLSQLPVACLPPGRSAASALPARHQPARLLTAFMSFFTPYQQHCIPTCHQMASPCPSQPPGSRALPRSHALALPCSHTLPILSCPQGHHLHPATTAGLKHRPPAPWDRHMVLLGAPPRTGTMQEQLRRPPAAQHARPRRGQSEQPDVP